VNITPDSFFDGGRFLDAPAAVAHALQLIEQGAEIIDIGGESTRPGASPVSEAEELRRVMPVIEQLAGRVKVPISIDTVKPGVARAALAAGASLVNDVAANRDDTALWEIVAEARAGYEFVRFSPGFSVILVSALGEGQALVDGAWYVEPRLRDLEQMEVIASRYRSRDRMLRTSTSASRWPEPAGSTRQPRSSTRRCASTPTTTPPGARSRRAGGRARRGGRSSD